MTTKKELEKIVGTRGMSGNLCTVSSVYSLVGLYKSCTSAITLYEQDYRIKSFLMSDLSS